MPGSRGVSKEAVGPPVQTVSCRGRKKVIADRVVDVQGGAGTNSVSATVIVEMHDVFIWTRIPVINESKATEKRIYQRND